MIQENKLGLVVSPKDANAFAEGLIKLMDDDVYRAGCGQRARTFAEANFSRNLLGDKFVSFLEEVSSLK